MRIGCKAYRNQKRPLFSIMVSSGVSLCLSVPMESGDG